jgi:hypothetical protein
MEGREIFDYFLKSSTFPSNHNEHIQEEHESSQVDLPAAESSPSSSTSLDSARELWPDPGTPEEEEIQPSEFFSRFEDDSSRDIRHTSNHLRHKKPTASLFLYETLDEVSHHASIVYWSKEAR